MREYMSIRKDAGIWRKMFIASSAATVGNIASGSGKVCVRYPKLAPNTTLCVGGAIPRRIQANRIVGGSGT